MDAKEATTQAMPQVQEIFLEGSGRGESMTKRKRFIREVEWHDDIFCGSLFIGVLGVFVAIKTYYEVPFWSGAIATLACLSFLLAVVTFAKREIYWYEDKS